MRRKPPLSHPSWHHPGLLLGLVGALLLLGAAPLHAVGGPDKILVMTTTSLKTTRFDSYFSAGFFGTGSDAIVNPTFIFHGHPLATAPGTPSLGSADTVIDLLDGITFQGTQPETKAMRTRILALDLASAVPLMVTYNGANPEAWNVRLCLSTVDQPEGVITLTDDCGTSSGTFVANFSVRPRLILTRVSDGLRRTADPGSAGFFALMANGLWTSRSATAGELLSVAAGARIDKDCDGGFDTTLPATSDIVLGLGRIGCNWLFPQQGYLALRPIVQTMYDTQVVLPTPAAAGALPFPLDNKAWSLACPELPDHP